MTPRVFARVAANESKRSGLRCRVLGKPELQRAGLTALLAVARGSAEPPRVVHLTYKPARPVAKRRILLVGKGVTFDSGGLDLKPAEAMLTMKMDMSGAATVLAAMTALERLGCPAEVHGLLGLVENMTGGAAYKPGDILETHAGKTVEVGNTDAEGRLVLCDLLSHGTKRIKPTHVVDVATLTGACVVALGLRASGLFTRDDRLRDALLEASGLHQILHEGDLVETQLQKEPGEVAQGLLAHSSRSGGGPGASPRRLNRAPRCPRERLGGRRRWHRPDLRRREGLLRGSALGRQRRNVRPGS